MPAPGDSLQQPARGFRHHALLYGDDGDYIATVRRFSRAASGPLLVAVPSSWSHLAQAPLTERQSAVAVVNACDTLANPRRLVSMISEFVKAHAGTPVAVLTQTDWARPSTETDEAAIADSLANLALAGHDLHLGCLVHDDSPEQEPQTARTHPQFLRGGVLTTSSRYEDPLVFCDPARWPLPEPVVPPAKEVDLDGRGLQAARDAVEEEAVSAGLPEPAVADLVLSVNELATNSITYADDRCRIRMWRQHEALVTEVSDSGHIPNPLADQQPASLLHPEDGTGLWLVNQLCDLVRIRSSATTGTVIRLHMRLPGRQAD